MLLSAVDGHVEYAEAAVHHFAPTGGRPIRLEHPVALLIFAPEATDPGRFEDYARLMCPQHTRLNLPTWIIGPALDSGPMMDRPAEIWKVWPERRDIELLLPSQFNPVIAELAARHCALR